MPIIESCCTAKQAAPMRAADNVANRSRAARIGRRSLSVATAAFAMLLPKCPLCVAAWGASLGLGETWQRWFALPFGSHVRPMMIAVLAAPLLAQLAIGARVLLRRFRQTPSGLDSISAAVPSELSQ